MAGAAITAGAAPAVPAPVRSHAVGLLQAFALTTMVFPSDAVIGAIGAGGYLAALVGMFLFAAWAAATAFGLHDPLRHRHPVRGVLCGLWATGLAAYVTMDRSVLTVQQSASADRYLMQLVLAAGVVLVAAECLTSLKDVRRVLRALTWGGAFCGVVAALQFWVRLDLTPYLRLLPGFEQNADNTAIMVRASLNRVAGTATHPIELGVVAGMVLPLAIHLALFDRERSARRRWTPVLLIAIAVPASVSRSAILAVVLALTVLIALMPARQRTAAACATPLALVVVFMTAHGLIGTLTSFFLAGTGDASVATRVDDYPMVERLVREAPWFGHGGGTYFAANAIDILDNQYLKSAIEVGLVGLLALVAYFVVPVLAALAYRRRSDDPELRLLCAALGGAALAGAVCSLTFDSLSFAMFAGVHALVVGLVGAACRLAAEEQAARPWVRRIGQPVGA